MNRFRGMVAVLALTGFLLAACSDILTPDTPDANEILMPSLPVYPGATLVQKYETSDLYWTGSFLWHVYAASGDGDAVRAFYKQNLADLGWQLDPSSGKDSEAFRFYKGQAELDLFVWDHEVPPNWGKGQVATPPPGTAVFFTVRVNHWEGPRSW